MAKELPMRLAFEVGVLGSIGNGEAWGISPLLPGYATWSMRQKYCKECGAIVQAGFRRAYEKKRREARKKPVKERPVQQPVLTLSEVAVASKACGMKYGEYVNYLYMHGGQQPPQKREA